MPTGTRRSDDPRIVSGELARDADAQFRLLFEAAPNGAMVVEQGGTIVIVNAQIETLFGYSRDELIGQSVELLMPQRFRAAHKMFRAEFDHQMRPMGARPNLYGLRKDGTEFPIEIGLNPIGPNGSVLACVFDISERKRNEEHIRILMRELSHRSKNLLMVILAILQQTCRQTSSLEEFRKRFEGRLLAIAHSNNVLVGKDWTGASAAALVDAQLEAFAEAASQIDSAGPPVMLKPDAAQNIGLALHELATNAIKYGALSSPDGKVVIRWEIDDAKTPKQFRMSWREDGGPRVSKPTREGFGYKLLTRIAGEGVGGHACIGFAPEGLTWRIEFPAEHVLTV